MVGLGKMALMKAYLSEISKRSDGYVLIQHISNSHPKAFLFVRWNKAGRNLIATRIFTAVLNGGEACYFFEYIPKGFYITVSHFVHHLVHIFSAEF